MRGKKWLYVLLIPWFVLLILPVSFTLLPLSCKKFQSPKKGKISRQELSEKRTRYSRAYRNPDGSRTTVIYASPVNYKDSRGRWKRVDTSIKDFEVREAPFWAKFGQTPSLRFSVGKVWVEFVPQLTNETKGVADENEIIYPEVFKSTDLKYSVQPSRLKEEIILKEASAPSVFIFEVHSNKALLLQKDGSLDFGYFKTLPPFATDAQGNRETVRVSMRRIQSNDYVILALNEKWRVKAKYPIVIDPTIIIQPGPAVGKDTYLTQGTPDNNSGTDNILDVHAGASSSARSLIQFDVSSIPTGSSIDSAIMSLYVNNAFGGEVFVRKITSDWDENLVTWNSQPSFEEVIATQVIDAANAWKSWDVTALLKDWYAVRVTNRGVVLLTAEDPAVPSGGEFYSSDYAIDVTLRPKLEVTYTIETIAPTSSITSPRDKAFITGTGYTITGTAKDNLGGAGIARVEVSTDGGNSWSEATGTTSWSYQWTFPADGQQTILSRATDLAGNVETAGPGVTVVVDNTFPQAAITLPPNGSVVSRSISLVGTASDPNFVRYRIEFGSGASPTSWTQLGLTGLSPVVNGVLGSGRLYRLTEGVYSFRVTVEDKAGNKSTDQIVVTVENPFVPTESLHKSFGADTSSCAFCHRSHTAVGKKLQTWLVKEADLCYTCHDGLGAPSNIRDEFDGRPSHHPIDDAYYSGQPGHVENCSDCHNPHGNKDPLGQYYARLLRVRDSQGNKIYQGNNFCGACHGSSTSGPGYQLGGDHITNFTGLAAHDVKVGEPSSGTKIKCSNCHVPHGSDFTRLNLVGEENLCYLCHNSANLPLLPNTLNNWDVQAQFSMSSHHDITSFTGGRVECSSCHGHTVKAAVGAMLSDPDNTKNLWSGSITNFCLRCHDGNVPLSLVNSTTVVPYTIAFPPISAPFFPGWNQSSYTLIPAGMSAVNSCATCHHPHGSNNARLVAFNYNNSVAYEEEKLCLTCHKVGGPLGAPDISTVLTKAYKHPVDTLSGIHVNTEDASNLGTTDSKRHSECSDCHNPHMATRETATPPANKGVNWGVGGVKADGTTVNPSGNQYEICFKCHSDYTSRPLGQTDKRAEFDPANPAYHPVETLGKNVGINPVAFVSPWNETSLVYCTDCHNNEDRTGAQCPVGSANQHILKDAYAATDTSLCFNCHTRSVYATPGAEGSRWVKHNITTGHTYCADCHETHGNKQEHLINRGYIHYLDGGKIVTDAKCAGAGCHATGVWIRYYTAY